MSREIDMSDLDALSKEDIQYLRDRGRLPAGYDGGEVSHTVTSSQIAEQENTNVASSQLSPADYQDAKKADLVEELERRGLDTDGTKDELIARLEENDGEQVIG